MRTVIFTPAARQELIDAQDWYEREASGLGRRFYVQVEAVVERMLANPLLFPVVYRDTRRALCKTFPYMLMFVIEPNDSLTVIACFHGSRDPLRWQNRL